MLPSGSRSRTKSDGAATRNFEALHYMYVYIYIYIYIHTLFQGKSILHGFRSILVQRSPQSFNVRAQHVALSFASPLDEFILIPV